MSTTTVDAQVKTDYEKIRELLYFVDGDDFAAMRLKKTKDYLKDVLLGKLDKSWPEKKFKESLKNCSYDDLLYYIKDLKCLLPPQDIDIEISLLESRINNNQQIDFFDLKGVERDAAIILVDKGQAKIERNADGKALLKAVGLAVIIGAVYYWWRRKRPTEEVKAASG
jgi:hypothetical protein